MLVIEPDPDIPLPIKPKDPAFLTDLINRHTDSLLGVAWGLGWRGTDAEDLIQDTFATFLKIGDRFEGRSSLKTFLIGILYKKSQEKRRDHSREIAADPIDQVFEERFGYWGIWRTMPKGPEDEALSKEIMVVVEQCVKKLPDQQRLAFYMREVEQESTDNICNILGLTVTHLGVVLFRARNKIRECVQRKWEKK